MLDSFLNGFTKIAEEKKHYLRRAVLGNPVSAAIEAEDGKKLESFGHALGHAAVEGVKGLGVGAAAGAAIGTLGAAALRKKLKYGAGIGAYLGGVLGSSAGSLKGHLDEKATEIHNRYSKK